MSFGVISAVRNRIRLFGGTAGGTAGAAFHGAGTVLLALAAVSAAALVPAWGKRHFVLPVRIEDGGKAWSSGAELRSQWRPRSGLRLNLAYTYLEIESDMDVPDESLGDFIALEAESKSPRHQVSFRSMLDLPNNLEADLWLRYADELEDPAIKAHTTMDLRLGWRPLDYLELSLVGRNLLDSGHMEFVDGFLNAEPTEIERSFYGMAKFSF